MSTVNRVGYADYVGSNPRRLHILKHRRGDGYQEDKGRSFKVLRSYSPKLERHPFDSANRLPYAQVVGFLLQ